MFRVRFSIPCSWQSVPPKREQPSLKGQFDQILQISNGTSFHPVRLQSSATKSFACVACCKGFGNSWQESALQVPGVDPLLFQPIPAKRTQKAIKGSSSLSVWLQSKRLNSPAMVLRAASPASFRIHFVPMCLAFLLSRRVYSEGWKPSDQELIVVVALHLSHRLQRQERLGKRTISSVMPLSGCVSTKENSTGGTCPKTQNQNN